MDLRAYALHVLAMAWAFARLFVTLWICIKTAYASITKSSLYRLPPKLSFSVTKFRAHG